MHHLPNPLKPSQASLTQTHTALTVRQVGLHCWVAQRPGVQVDSGPPAPLPDLALAPRHRLHIEEVGPAYARLAIPAGVCAAGLAQAWLLGIAGLITLLQDLSNSWVQALRGAGMR